MPKFASSFAPVVLITAFLSGLTATVAVVLTEPLSRRSPDTPEVVRDLIRSGDGRSAIVLRSTETGVVMSVATNKKSLELTCETGVGPRVKFYHNGEPVMSLEMDDFGGASVSFRDGRKVVTFPTPAERPVEDR